jgi:perosamine synthetase
MTVPFHRPSVGEAEIAEVVDTLRSGWLTTGPKVARLQREFAAAIGARHAVALNSGTAALHVALEAVGVTAGDEVIIPTYTFTATGEVVTYLGARPVLADCRADTLNIDAETIEPHLTSRTKAILPVHVAGQACDMQPILELARTHGLAVVEDAAHALPATYKGRSVGTIADVTAFSFYATKTITTGEGGMVTTDDPALAAEVRRLKNHGMDPHRKYWYETVGFNYRLTNVAAAIGLAQLEKVDWHLARRREIADWYREALADVPGVTWQPELPWAWHVWWLFTVQIDERIPIDRFALMQAMKARGVEVRQIIYPNHVLPPYVGAGASCPVAERVVERGLHLPTWAGLTKDDVRTVCHSLAACLEEAGR